MVRWQRFGRRAVLRPEHRPPSGPTTRRNRRLRLLRTFVITFGVLLGLRAAMPFGVRAYVNHVLEGMEGHRGSVDAVRLNLWRGSYEIDGLKLFQRGSSTTEPLVEMRRLDLSVQWRGLLRGRVVAEAVCHHPVLYFAKLPPERGADVPPEARGDEGEELKTGTGEAWALHLDELFPFEINRFVIRDGEVRYRDATLEPAVDLYMTDFYLEALNIANVREKSDPEGLFAEIEAAGRPFGTAEFELRVRFDPLSDPLQLELDASARHVQLTDLNDFLLAHGGFDAEGGRLDVFAEFATTEGIVEGYVKTLFEDMRILRVDEIDGPVDAVEAVWEGLVSLASEVLENQPHDRLATRVPLRGTTETTAADLSATVWNLLRNAFFTALGPAIDDTVELRGMEIVTEEDEAKATADSRGESNR